MVMPGLVPGIHVLKQGRRGWHRKSGLPDFRKVASCKSGIPACSDKPGHDGLTTTSEEHTTCRARPSKSTDARTAISIVISRCRKRTSLFRQWCSPVPCMASTRTCAILPMNLHRTGSSRRRLICSGARFRARSPAPMANAPRNARNPGRKKSKPAKPISPIRSWNCRTCSNSTDARR